MPFFRKKPPGIWNSEYMKNSVTIEEYNPLEINVSVDSSSVWLCLPHTWQLYNCVNNFVNLHDLLLVLFLVKTCVIIIVNHLLFERCCYIHDNCYAEINKLKLCKWSWNIYTAKYKWYGCETDTKAKCGKAFFIHPGFLSILGYGTFFC